MGKLHFVWAMVLKCITNLFLAALLSCFTRFLNHFSHMRFVVCLKKSGQFGFPTFRTFFLDKMAQ